MVRASVLSLALALLSACGGNRVPADDDVALVEGARLYRTYCGLCHGDRGEGYAADAANALFNAEFLRSATDEFLRRAIAEGHPGTAMAAYERRLGGPLSTEEITALVRFIRSKARGEPIARPITLATSTIDPRPLYESHCATCHGERGQGGSALSLDNPIFTATADDAFIRHAIVRGRPGTPMPAFQNRMDPASIDALVGYVRGFGQARGAPSARRSDIPEDLPTVIHPDGPQATFTLREGRFVSSADLARALSEGKRLVIVDARPPSEWSLLHIPGAIPVPYYAVDDLARRLPTDGTYIVAYCACPHAASGRVVDELRERGFANTAVLDEGILVWRELGHPVEGSATEE